MVSIGDQILFNMLGKKDPPGPDVLAGTGPGIGLSAETVPRHRNSATATITLKAQLDFIFPVEIPGLVMIINYTYQVVMGTLDSIGLCVIRLIYTSASIYLLFELNEKCIPREQDDINNNNNFVYIGIVVLS